MTLIMIFFYEIFFVFSLKPFAPQDRLYTRPTHILL